MTHVLELYTLLCKIYTYIVLFKNWHIYCVDFDTICGCRFLTPIMCHIEHNMCHFWHIRFYSAGLICKKANHKHQFYGVLTQWGVLNNSYRSSDLESYSGVVDVILEGFEKKYKNISLTEAARLQGLSTDLDKSP